MAVLITLFTPETPPFPASPHSVSLSHLHDSSSFFCAYILGRGWDFVLSSPTFSFVLTMPYTLKNDPDTGNPFLPFQGKCPFLLYFCLLRVWGCLLCNLGSYSLLPLSTPPTPDYIQHALKIIVEILNTPKPALLTNDN